MTKVWTELNEKGEVDKMTLEQYMRELWLMNKQYGQEEELYPLINMLLREGSNTENLSIRDVHDSEKAEGISHRKYIDGFGSFPDLAIFDEDFPNENESANKKNTILENIYGCVEAKKNGINEILVSIDQVEICRMIIDDKYCYTANEKNIVAHNNAESLREYEVKVKIVKGNYIIRKEQRKPVYVAICNENFSVFYLHKDNMGAATATGQFMGELLWYGKVLYTDGLIWKYYKLSKKSGKEINEIRKKWIASNDLPENKTWIFEECEEKEIVIDVKNIGNLTELFNKKQNEENSTEELTPKDYQEWKEFENNLAEIDWTENVFNEL